MTRRHWNLAFVLSLAGCTATSTVGMDDAGRPDAYRPPVGRYDECGNGLDDDGDGAIDEDCPCGTGETQPCWDGARAARGVGACGDGVQQCSAAGSDEFGRWLSCTMSRGPDSESCEGSTDEDCDGAIDEGCTCTEGASRACTGPSEGACSAGAQSCRGGTWSACEGAVGPSAEVCGNGLDDDCDGVSDDPSFCSCSPVPEVCGNGADDDCDGETDEMPCAAPTPDAGTPDAGMPTPDAGMPDTGEMPACEGGMGCLRLLAGALGGAGSADGTGAAARFHSPTGIAVDSSGTIFVADTGNHTIRRVTAAGVVTTVAGRAGIRGSANGTGAAATFDGPSGIAVGPAGELFVADKSNHQVRRISPAGEASLFAGSPIERPGDTDGTGSAATFNFPSQLAIDASGNLLVGEGLGLRARSRIRRVTPAAVVSTLALSGAVGGGLAVFADGSRAFAPEEDRIYEVNLGTGALTDVAGLGCPCPPGGRGFRDGTGADARFDAPGGMATNSIDRLFVADGNNHAIRAISYPGRVVTTLAGAPSSGPRFDFGGFADGTGSGARFSYPTGLAFHAGALFVTEAGNHAIRRVDVSSGAVTTIAGSGPVIGSSDGEGTTARFAGPRQLVADSAGNWYLADFGNNAIRRVTPSGSVSTLVAGICGADGEPLSIAIDASGNLYVGCWNGTLRRVTPAGVVSDVLTTAEAAGIESLAVDPDGTTLTWSTQGVVRRKAGSADPVNLFDAARGARIAVATTGGRTFVTVQNMVFSEGALLEIVDEDFRRTLVPDIGVSPSGSLGQLSASRDGTALFWADPAGHRIQRLALDGSDTVATVVGATGQVGVVLGPLPGRLNAPTGVAVDPRGRIGIVMGSRFFGGTTGGEAALLIAEP